MTEDFNTSIEVLDIDLEKNYGKFAIMPLDRGYGTTLGNSMRRVLLGSLPGSAIATVKIDGVGHEFTTIKGSIADVPEILINIKGIALKKFNEEPVVLELNVKGPKVVTAGDISENQNVEIANKDHYITTLNEEGEITMDLLVLNGKGYRVSDLNKEYCDINSIAVDSSFSPVKKVNFTVGNTRVGQSIDFDKLEIEVWTDGTITPQEALSTGAGIFIDYLSLFRALPDINLDNSSIKDGKNLDANSVLSKSVEELDLSLRSFNCLKRANLDTVKDIISQDIEQLKKIKNFGKKSVEEVIDKMHELGLKFLDEE